MSREIDALVAEHVMGLYPILGKGLRTPNYSTDIAAAWEVVDKLAINEYLNLHKQRHGDRINFTANIIDSDTGGKFSTNHQEAPMAICLAALKAKGIKV